MDSYLQLQQLEATLDVSLPLPQQRVKGGIVESGRVGKGAAAKLGKEFSFSRTEPKLQELCRRCRLKVNSDDREREQGASAATAASVASVILPRFPLFNSLPLPLQEILLPPVLLGQAHHIVHELLFIVS